MIFFQYSVWHLFWLAWNVFIICLYLDVAGLNHKVRRLQFIANYIETSNIFFIEQQNKVLKLDPYSRSSWWENGPGCKETLNKTAPIPIVEKVTDCWFDYRQVEIFQASLQGILAVSNFLFNVKTGKIDLTNKKSTSYTKTKATEIKV